MNLNGLDEEQIEQHFVEWWRDSYGMPPGKHAIMTHVAYAIKFHSDQSTKPSDD